MGRMTWHDKILYSVITAVVLTAGVGLIREIQRGSPQMIREEFQYGGKRAYVEHSERDSVEKGLCSTIHFENGDVIRSGSITADDGRKIQVYVPSD